MSQTKPKIFKIYSDEIQGRLDPYFYLPEIYNLKRKLKDNFKNCYFRDVIESIYRYPTFYGIKYQSSGIPVIKGQNIDEFGVIRQNQNFDYISKEIHDKFSKTKILKNDLIFTVRGVIGKVGFFSGFVPEANINANVIKIKIKKEYNPKFFWYFLNSNIGQKIISNLTSGQVQKTITVPDIKNIQIPNLPIEIQNKIVSLMDSAYKQKQEKEEEAKRLLNSIDEYILKELDIKIPELKNKKCFSVYSDELENKRIDPFYYQPKFKELENAVSRGRYKIEKIKNYIKNIHYGTSIKNDYVSEGIPLLRILNLKPNELDLSNVVKLSENKRKEIGNNFVYQDDLLISRSGSIGIVAVVPKKANGFAFGSFIIKFQLNENVNKEFISILLNNKLFQLFIQKEKIGAIQGNITIPIIKNLPIILPPLEIQNKIANEVKRRMEKAKKLKLEAENVIKEAKQIIENTILKK